MTNTKMPRSPPRLFKNDRSVAGRRCLLLVVEGVNDVEFLRRISWILHRSNVSLPDLKELEQHGRIVFLPFGGGNVAAWATRLEPLGPFHQRSEALAAVREWLECHWLTRP